MHRSQKLALLAVVVALTIGCSTKPTDTAKPETTLPKSASSDCPGGKLQGTSLCQDQAKALLAMTPGKHPSPPKGCEWMVNEVEIAGGDYVLYLAASCANGKVTTLDYAGGAHKAELKFAVSGVTGLPERHKIIEIHGMDEKDAHAAVLRAAREAISNRADAAQCSVRPSGVDGYPSDALVVDVSPAVAAQARKDQPRTACGRYGYTDDSQRFWRVFQTFSWFFELGQDDLDIDPGSLTMISRDEKLSWVRTQ